MHGSRAVNDEKRRPKGLNSLLKKSGISTLGAEAPTENKAFIAALKRCATQNLGFSANYEVHEILNA
jgi:hypothetical protein